MEQEQQAGQEPTKKERRQLKRQVKLEARAGADRSRKIKATLWIFVVAIVVLSIGGLIWFAATQGEEISEGVLSQGEYDNDWRSGNSDSSVVLVEYADFQCPACGSYHPILKQLKEVYGDRVSFVFRHFPLTQIHRQAELAGIAAEAAGLQGKFWEMHDMLFENQREWSNNSDAEEIFIDYARELSLDTNKFKSDLDVRELRNKVRDQASGGTRSGVRGTPSFFLNGDKINNPRNFDDFSRLLDATLANLELN